MREEGLDQNRETEAPAPSPCRIGKRILLADDHELLREALRAVISGLDPEITLFECTGFNDALDLASQHDGLDLAILGLRMAGMGGLEGIRRFRARFPEVPVIVSCCHCDAEEMIRVFRCGAAGFIPESLDSRGVKAVIELVLAGQVYIPADILALVERLQEQNGQPPAHLDENGKAHALTRREQQTLELLVEGHSNKGIARALDIQEVTVKLHLRSIFRKLGVVNRSQAVRVAIESGWFGRQGG
ncbi:MAG: LuxR C-terminal-related transcriptional regulator [Kiloniellales bacterium]